MAFRAGIVGFGLSGRVFHAPLMAPAGIELAAIASSKPAEVNAAYPDAQVYASAQELFADSSIDLVTLASPSPTHYPLALEALRAGKHVVIDKPFAPTAEAAQHLIDTAAEVGKTVCCYQNRRWDSDHLTLAKLMDEGRLGEVHQYEAHFEFYKPEPATDVWKEQSADAVGVHYDLGTHLIDQVVKLFGVPDWVQGEAIIQRPGSEIFDNFYARLAYGSMRATIHGSLYCADYRSRLLVHGSKASYRKYHMDPQEAQLRAGSVPGQAGYGFEPKSACGEVTTVRDKQVKVEPEPSVIGSYADFYRLTREAIEQQTTLPVPPQQSLDVIRIIEALVKSGETGQRVEF